MYILVTGGLGFIGSHCICELILNGHKPIILDNLTNSSTNVLDRIKKITKTTDLIFIEGDITNIETLSNIFTNYPIDSVIHFAALKAVGESVSNPLKYYTNNINGTLNLLEVMKSYNCKKIIFSSSATVYGSNNSPNGFYESNQIGIGISNPYGRTKYMIELILNDLIISDPSWSIVILRYFNPVGAHPSGLLGESPLGQPNNLFPIITKSLSTKTKLSIYGSDYPTPDGTCIRDFVHIMDLVDGHILALGKLVNSGLYVYNLGTGKGTSVKEIIEQFAQSNNIALEWTYKDKRPGDLPETWANTEKAHNELGFIARRTIRDMCIDTYRFWVNNT